MADTGRLADRASVRRTSALRMAAAGALSLVAVTATLAAVMARVVVIPPTKRKEDVRIFAVDLENSRIMLTATPDSVLPGRYGLWFCSDTGHVRLGEVISRSSTGVTREILGVDFGALAGASKGRFSGWFYPSPEALGYDCEPVEVDTALGQAPAWLIPAKNGSARWVIQVHGRAVTRAETLRALPVFHDAGYTSLHISYRNDGEAPPSADGRYALGDTEWRDVESAMVFAREHGARQLVLMGWSMGGAAVLQAATRSRLRDMIRGVVLESPVIEWSEALAFQAKLVRFPCLVASVAKWILAHPWGGLLTGQNHSINFEHLDMVRGASGLEVPILLLHSDDDGYVPATASHALAALRPDLVTMETFSVARHTKLWNYDPSRWTAAIDAWLDALTKEDS